VIDWAPAAGEGDKILFVFDGGLLTGTDLNTVTLADGEIADVRFTDVSEFDQYLPARLARRLHLAMQLRERRHRPERPLTGPSRDRLPPLPPRRSLG
jgi:hypothetical protein